MALPSRAIAGILIGHHYKCSEKLQNNILSVICHQLLHFVVWYC